MSLPQAVVHNLGIVPPGTHDPKTIADQEGTVEYTLRVTVRDGRLRGKFVLTMTGTRLRYLRTQTVVCGRYRGSKPTICRP